MAVADRAPSTGYSRDAFGQRWADVDRNGCDTRNDVLARDLTDVVFRAGSACVVASGVLADPYTGAAMPFLRGDGTSDDIQIDHVVALAAAWRTGAQSWDEPTRTAFANDPLNLLAVDGDANQAKGDSDAASWLPPAATERCPYVARQIAVKQRYGAWVTPTERDAMTAVLIGCPGEALPGSPGLTPTPSTSSTAVPTTAPVAGCLIKGNINGDGERIYHLPGSRSYDETRIDTDRGERWLCTEQDAVDAGWRAPRT
nr:HNH endonuclease family protein [Nakamurella flavida]